MSELLDALIEQRRKEALEYEQYLAKIVALAKQVQSPEEGTAYPSSLNTLARRALFDNLEGNEHLAIALDTEIRKTKKDDWRGNNFKEKEVRIAIRKHISDEALGDRIFELARNQREY
jgi:type I restriction enzyme R subunit